MKKFTLMLIAALIAVFTQAAPPADVLGKANLNPVRTTATPVLLNAKQAPAKMKQAQIAKKHVLRERLLLRLLNLPDPIFGSILQRVVVVRIFRPLQMLPLAVLM